MRGFFFILELLNAKVGGNWNSFQKWTPKIAKINQVKDISSSANDKSRCDEIIYGHVAKKRILGVCGDNNFQNKLRTLAIWAIFSHINQLSQSPHPNKKAKIRSDDEATKTELFLDPPGIAPPRSPFFMRQKLMNYISRMNSIKFSGKFGLSLRKFVTLSQNAMLLILSPNGKLLRHVYCERASRVTSNYKCLSCILENCCKINHFWGEAEMKTYIRD